MAFYTHIPHHPIVAITVSCTQLTCLYVTYYSVNVNLLSLWSPLSQALLLVRLFWLLRVPSPSLSPSHVHPPVYIPSQIWIAVGPHCR